MYMKTFLSRIVSWSVVSLLIATQATSAMVSAHSDPANLIQNHDLEIASSGTPAAWQFNSWGTLSAKSGYEDSGDALRGMVARTSVTSYASGDAKWYFAPVAVTAGQKYVFSDSYRATIGSEVVAQYGASNGSVSYAWFGTAPASAGWSTFRHEFVVPSGVTSMTVFHLLAANGDLWTDDYGLAPAVEVAPSGDNLIANPSAEIASAGSPAGWSFNQWGDISAAASYETTGQHGVRSLKASVTRYTSGDAKWYFAPVAVEASTAYTFTDYYKATVSSMVFAQIETTSGAYSYIELGVNTAASDWTKSTHAFTTPSGAKKVTIFHVIASVGELTVDNYSLTKGTPPPAPITGVINNPSFETANPSNAALPAGWEPSGWGTNTRTFTYVNGATNAHSGTRAARVNVTSYTDGDAKWYFAPVQLAAGVDYEYSDWYKSNVDSRVVLEVTKQDGSIAYIELPIATKTGTSWKQYKGTFTMPADGVKVSVYHMLSRVGTLTIDDVAFNTYTPQGFARGLVTLTFDDGWEDNISTAFPIMDSFGYKSNQFYATQFIQNSELGRSYAETTVRAIRDQGHEMGSHTITHPDLTTLTTTQLNNELSQSKNYLQTLYGQPVTYFASPYGAYNTQVLNRIGAYYTLHRTVDAGYNSRDNFNVMQLKVQNVLSNTTAAEVASWVQKAAQDRTWLILVYHRVANDPGPYDTTPALFTQHLTSIRDAGVPVVKISQALAELQPQLTP